MRTRFPLINLKGSFKNDLFKLRLVLAGTFKKAMYPTIKGKRVDDKNPDLKSTALKLRKIRERCLLGFENGAFKNNVF